MKGLYVSHRTVSKRFHLEPGHYVIIPYSYDKNILIKYYLRLFTENTIEANSCLPYPLTDPFENFFQNNSLLAPQGSDNGGKFSIESPPTQTAMTYGWNVQFNELVEQENARLSIKDRIRSNVAHIKNEIDNNFPYLKGFEVDAKGIAAKEKCSIM
jgi:hypothetical protein